MAKGKKIYVVYGWAIDENTGPLEAYTSEKLAKDACKKIKDESSEQRRYDPLDYDYVMVRLKDAL